MKMKAALIASSFCFLHNLAIAETTSLATNTPITIPIVQDAQVFSKFDDKYPAMVNYFTKSSFNQVTVFYSDQFGAPLSEQVQYGRLELKFSNNNHEIRVIVDDQVNHREVDLIIE